MVIELIGGPHCGMTLTVRKVPPVVVQIHSPREGQRWEAYYVPDGTVTNEKRWRCCYTEQRKVIRPVSPPVVPGME
jgi:hypothetical protein